MPLMNSQSHGLIQATVDMNADKTRKREIGSLAKAMAAVGLERGTVVTLHEEDSVQTKAGTIEMIPAWKWRLSQR